MSRKIAKVPVVIQLEALECGAACLTMILAYYGKWIPLEQVRKDCGVSRNGSNLMNVIKAGQSYGLTYEAYKMEPDMFLREEQPYPCLIHWEFNHFVVLKGVKNGKFYINDPARGDVVLTETEFDEGFTGVTVFFQPGEQFEKGGKPQSILGFAKSRLKDAKTAVVFAVLTSLIASLLGLIRPAFDRVFIDRLLSGENPSWLTPFTLLFLLLSLVQISVTAITTIYNNRINGKLAVEGSSSYMWKVLHLPIEFFSQRNSADIIAREGENATIARTMASTLAPMVLNSAMAVLYFILMINYSIPLTVVGFLALLCNGVLSIEIHRKMVNLSRVSISDTAKYHASITNGIEMIETVKSAGAENAYFSRISGYDAEIQDYNIKSAELEQYTVLATTMINTVSNLLIQGIAIYLIMQDQYTLGMMTAFQGFLTGFSAPIQSLVSAGNTLQTMKSQMERVEDVMKYPEDELITLAEQQDMQYEKLSGAIELRHVTFGYSRLAEPMLNDISLTLKPGQKVALVGASGCGKSTIAKLICGLYQPWSGEILFDGKPISEINRFCFKSSVAVVDQEITLFEDTINNNLKLWDESIPDTTVVEAARDAMIHKDILEKEGGYTHRLREAGKDFSGGQRQRLEIARALAGEPTILILDEATSALDARTEHNVVEAIDKRGLTCIVVAHRLSTIRDADEIIVMDRGRIAERGTHEELMQGGTLYRTLVAND